MKVYRYDYMSKGKVKKEKEKITQYCSVCKDTFEMEVVRNDDDKGGVPWLKCPGCEGFLPYMGGEEEEGTAGEEELELAPEDLSAEERENARVYDQSEEYDIDDIIYQRSWNDYGKVMDKEVLPGGRKVIIVQFIGQGRMRLLEGAEQ